jgi:hypothetical protein
VIILTASIGTLTHVQLRAPNTIGFGIHFADVQFGRVVDGTWQPLD